MQKIPPKVNFQKKHIHIWHAAHIHIKATTPWQKLMFRFRLTYLVANVGCSRLKLKSKRLLFLKQSLQRG